MEQPSFEEAGVLTRHPANPLLTSGDVPYPCALLFNAGICKWQGEYVMVFRNDFGPKDAVDFRQRGEDRHPRFDGTNLGLARSDDGVHCRVEHRPLITLEDARRLFYSPRPEQGSADTVECLATAHVDDLVKACLEG